MGKVMDDLRTRKVALWLCRSFLVGCGLVAFTTVSVTALGQAQTTTTHIPGTQPSAHSPRAHESESASQNSTVGAGAFALQSVGGKINEDQLKQLLVGKTLYLRSGYQDNNLEFDEWGRLIGHSPQGSYTLSQIQISRVKLTKHKLELQGDRYALHFLGAAPYEDPIKATDRVKITPKRKVVRISFDRVQVDKPKTKKEKDKENKKDKSRYTGSCAKAPLTSQSDPDPSPPDPIPSQPPVPSASVDKPKTTSPAVSSGMLLTALDKVFSLGIDQRMIASMPEFWKLYYDAEAKHDFKPGIAGVYRQDNVDQKARLISVLDPPSNAFAQANGVAGIALYHAVVGSDGKVEEIVVGRPIGLGLDENAEQAIRKAVFQPAMKDGKPVPVALDLVVSFRIYSKLTSQPSAQADNQKPGQPVLLGPYSVQEHTQAAQQSQTPQQPDATQEHQKPH